MSSKVQATPASNGGSKWGANTLRTLKEMYLLRPISENNVLSRFP